MPDENIDYDALLSEAIAEQGVEGDQPGADAAQGDETAQVESTETHEPTIEIGGETLTLTEAQELLGKGKDYTRKTQQLAQERKQLAAAAQFQELWDAGDAPTRRRMLELLQSQVPDDEPQLPDDYEMWSDEGRRLFAENQELKKNLSQVQQVMNDLKGYVQDQRLSQEASRLAQSMSSEYGVSVTDQDIKQAMRETGIQDPEAAWLKLHHKKLLGVAKIQGVQEGSKTKPLAPRSQNNTFTLDDVGNNVDEAIRRVQSGQQLVD